MRAKRETTYGMPTRILANADRVRTMQNAHDHDAAHRKPGQHHRLLTQAHPTACRRRETMATAVHPRPRWPRPLAERAAHVRSQGVAHAQR